MNYHNITHDDMLNGDGLRVVLWVSGCTHQCDGCQNPITWDMNGGLPFGANEEAELFSYLKKDYTAGVTFSGGDPFHPKNRDRVCELAKQANQIAPEKTVWVYTGYLWEEVYTLPVMNYVDVLVDGKYDKQLRNSQMRWCGSSNQRVIDVKKSLASGQVTLWTGAA